MTEGHFPLILTGSEGRTEHFVQMLASLCRSVLLLAGTDVQKAKREKLKTLKAVPSDEPMIVAATEKHICGGFNAPRLDSLLLIMPVEWKGMISQYMLAACTEASLRLLVSTCQTLAAKFSSAEQSK